MEAPQPCPFCGFKAASNYRLMYHLEEEHSEGVSPFVCDDPAVGHNGAPAPAASRSEAPTVDNFPFVFCEVDGCGEAIPLPELDLHAEMHKTETSCDATSSNEAIPQNPRQKRTKQPASSNGHSSSVASSTQKQEAAKASWKALLRMPDSSNPSHSILPQLKNPLKNGKGKDGLGPYANEKQMPERLRKLIESDGQHQAVRKMDSRGRLEQVQFQAAENYAEGIIPVLEQLLSQDTSVERAYLCHPSVQHISKLNKEGGFCGYRNLQMMASYIIAAKHRGFPHFNDKIPTIFQIQNYIEHAWDLGINAQCRAETGGIKGTRKYIGTPEAQAMLLSLDIPIQVRCFKSTEDRPAYQKLLEYAEGYFKDASKGNRNAIINTGLPPLYLQQPGHSLTIVGFEEKVNGDRGILVFNPSFHDNASVLKRVGQTNFREKRASELLEAYRKESKHLHRHKEFEILRLLR